MPIYSFVLLLLQQVSGLHFHYKFYNNYGDAFFDYSLNGYIAEKRGETFDTDRGAYCKQGGIYLPPNSWTSQTLDLGSDFNLLAWVFPATPGPILVSISVTHK